MSKPLTTHTEGSTSSVSTVDERHEALRSPRPPLMSHEERRKLIEKPFPPIRLYRPGLAHGGTERPPNHVSEAGHTDPWYWVLGARKPSLDDYDCSGE